MEESSCSGQGNIPDTSANNTLNPFEADSVDSLHLTQFSPSVFARSAATPASSKKSSLFRWSIDQLAILHPADIDEHALQQESTLDSDTEERAQLAIEQFFSQQHLVPSPWSVKRPIKHVTFSPNPPTVSEAKDSNSCSEAPERSSHDNENSCQNKERTEVSCQTTVTLPVDFDLQAVLGDQFAFNDSQAEGVNELSSSSLRRKLFSQGEASPIISPVGVGLDHQISPERIPDIPSPQISPIRQVDDTTLSASDISHVQTPGSVQSQFSSSPISSKLTPRRWTPYSQGSRAASSVGHIGSPSFSPISSTFYPATSDSSNPICDSSVKGKAPPCDMIMPDASPILPHASKSRSGMLFPFLASMEPPSVEMTSVSFSGDENHLEGAKQVDHPCASTQDDKHSAPDRPPHNDSDESSDSTDRSDYNDSGDSQSLDPAGATSVCSMEQSYIRLADEFSEERPLSGQSSSCGGLQENDEEMLNGAGDSLFLSQDMLSFEGYDGTSMPCAASRKQLTSTLRLRASHAPSDSIFTELPLSLKSFPETSLNKLGSCVKSGSGINSGSTVTMEMAGVNPGSKFREVVTPMQSDSGFNSHSFTSMEVTDSEGQIEAMQANEYSVGNCPPMADNKENLCRWKNQLL
ncbi:protein aurora borealis-like isoform X2 [Patiria miniata]|nr:protein aurora borealis-like isoform X2 [Patiria miniata]XP_038053393.1 protein aurora borealis-like isoform X2 [Patiria miniata]